MSILSYLSTNLIKYLDKCGINLQTYETTEKRGFWAILFKNERSYIARISYLLTKKCLSVSWTWCSENKHKREKIRHISHLIMLQFLFIYFKEEIQISCREFDQKLFGKIRKPIKDCFLCKNNSCLLCDCKHDIMNMITTMYDKNDLLCFDPKIPEICSKFRGLYGTFIKDFNCSAKFVRDYMDAHNYMLCTQDILDTSTGIEGNITIFKKTQCIGLVEFSMKDNVLNLNIKTCKKTKCIKVIVYHLLFAYPSDCITIKLSEFYKKVATFFKDIGFHIKDNILSINFTDSDKNV